MILGFILKIGTTNVYDCGSNYVFAPTESDTNTHGNVDPFVTAYIPEGLEYICVFDNLESITNLYLRVTLESQFFLCLYFTQSLYTLHPNWNNQNIVLNRLYHLEFFKGYFTKWFGVFNDIYFEISKFKKMDREVITWGSRPEVKYDVYRIYRKGHTVYVAVYGNIMHHLICAPGVKLYNNIRWFGQVYVGPDTWIKSFATLYHNVLIGTNTYIGYKSTLSEGAIVGSNCYVEDCAEIGSKCILRDNSAVRNYSHNFTKAFYHYMQRSNEIYHLRMLNSFEYVKLGYWTVIDENQEVIHYSRFALYDGKLINSS